MATSHDQHKDIAAGLESTVGDLDVPEAVAEQAFGGDTSASHIIKQIPGNVKWQDVTLKRGMTSD
jgi:hypothetical protein